MNPPRHLLTVWNPSYWTDALDAHLAVLLGWAQLAAGGEAERDDVYVWWGKIRSKHRDGMLPHHKAVLALDGQHAEGTETHLYLTDYRSLYVGEVGEITDEDVRENSGESDHMPSYYTDHPVDLWFRLFDIRRIVTDDTPAVIAELKKLKDTRYHDRPVSLYGGIRDVPLILTREPEVQWFSDRDALTEGALWAERAAAHRSEAAQMARELRDNLFGRELWTAMEPTTRSFLSSAEAVFRARRYDARFDVSGVAVEYAKAVETELNAMIFPAVRRVAKSWPPSRREVWVKGRRLDLGGVVPHQTLGVMINLLKHCRPVAAAVEQQYKYHAKWVLGSLPPGLGDLVHIRNEGAHSAVTDAEKLGAVRDAMLGVGCEGLLGRLVELKARARSRWGWEEGG